MATALQAAAVAVANGALAIKRHPGEPAARAEYEAAVERLAATRAAVAITRTVNGRLIDSAARRRILEAVVDVLDDTQETL